MAEKNDTKKKEKKEADESKLKRFRTRKMLKGTRPS